MSKPKKTPDAPRDVVVKVGDLPMISAGLQQLMQTPSLHARLKFRIGKALREMAPVMKDFGTQRDALITKYGTPVPGFVVMPDNPNLAEYTKEMQALLEKYGTPVKGGEFELRADNPDKEKCDTELKELGDETVALKAKPILFPEESNPPGMALHWADAFVGVRGEEDEPEAPPGPTGVVKE